MLWGERAWGTGEAMWRAGERGGEGEVRRGEEGRLSGLCEVPLPPLPLVNRFLLSVLGLAKGLVGGLGELPGDDPPPSECASIGLTRRPVLLVGDARRDTSSTCKWEGSKGPGLGDNSTRPF